MEGVFFFFFFFSQLPYIFLVKTLLGCKNFGRNAGRKGLGSRLYFVQIKYLYCIVIWSQT